MKKIKSEEKKKVVNEEYTPDDEGFSRLKEEVGTFISSTKLYVSESVKLYTSFFKRLYERLSCMLSEELGEEEASYRRRGKLFLISLLMVGVGILISSTPFTAGAYPASLSVISSAGLTRKGRGAFTPRLIMALTLISTVLSTLFMKESGLIYFTVIFTVFIMRSVVTHGEFDESIVFRTLTSFGAAVLLSSFQMIIDSFSLRSVGISITLSLSVPIFTYVFSGLFSCLGDTLESGIRMRAEVGMAALMFLITLSLKSVGLFGFSLAAAFGFAVTVVVSKRLGPMHAGVFGMLTGIGAGGGLFAVVYGVIGVFSAMFFTISDFLSLSVAVLVSSAISVYIGGFEGILATLPEVLFGAVIVYPILKFFPVSEQRVHLMAGVGTSEAHERESVERKLEKMSGTFATLSEVFFAVTDSLKTPATEDVIFTVDNAMNKVCATCSMSGACWSKYYADSCDTKVKLSERLNEQGRIEREDFPDFFKERCGKIEELCEFMNKRYASFCLDSNDSTRAGLIAGEYHTVSKLLKSTAEGFSRSATENSALGIKAKKALKGVGIQFSRIEAWGQRKSVIDVFGVEEEKIDRSSEAIVASFESECGMLFEEPEFIILDGISLMRMKRRFPITLECAKKSCTKKGEKINGDTVSFFENEEGFFYALISDGMGSGRDAALTSRLASIFLEKLLTCTDDKKSTLEMLNTLLMTKKEECFTTLDLVEFDLFERSASFLKAGAAPSFIVREDKVYKVNSKTPPAGIIKKLSAEETKITVKDGDMIVLLSDGIIDTADVGALDNPWLVELLDGNREKSAGDMADIILSEALSRFSAEDDMSVAVIRVSKG